MFGYQNRFDGLGKFPTLHPPDDDDDYDYDNATIKDIAGSFSPFLIFPPERKLKKKAPRGDTSTSTTKNTSRRRRGNYETRLESIEEETEIPSRRVVHEDDFVSSSCCRSHHCHHYAYARPNTNSYAAFVDNFLNGRIPALFNKLQRMYVEMQAFFEVQPWAHAKIMFHVEYYRRALLVHKVRMLNCIKCLLDLIRYVADLHKSFLLGAEKTPVGDAEIIRFFYALDGTIVALLAQRHHDSDLAETAKPVENFVYQTLYSCMVTLLRGAYAHISQLLAVTAFPWQMHNEIVTETRLARPIHLGVLAETIARHRRVKFAILDDENYCRMCLYDRSYMQWFDVWRDFVEVYCGGSLEFLLKAKLRIEICEMIEEYKKKVYGC